MPNEQTSVASDISLNEQFIFVSNSRLFALVDFANEVGESIAGTDEERAYVARFKEFSAGAYPGISLDLAVQFPATAERKWWARVFHIVARRIFLRRLGNQDNETWQPSTIGDAYVVARMLTRAVQEVETAWHPVVDDPAEADAFTNGPINLRV